MRLAFHRTRIEAAKVMRANAELAYLRSQAAAKQEELAAEASIAARRLTATAERAGNPEATRAAAQLSEMRASLDRLQARTLAEGRQGKDTAAGRTVIQQLLKAVNARQTVLKQHAIGNPVLRPALKKYEAAANAHRRDRLLIAVNAKRGQEAVRAEKAAKEKYVELLQAQAARLGGFQLLDAANYPPGEESRLRERPPSGEIKDGRRRPPVLAPRLVPAKFIFSKQPPARRATIGGVHKREDLQDPAYLEKLVKRRLGSLGSVYQFKNEDELKKAVEKRLGGYGVVHRMSDLKDPDYLAKVWKQRLGGYGSVFKIESPEQLRDMINKRLGGFGRAFTCKDMMNAGMSQNRADAFFRNAARYQRQGFENDQAYKQRMLKKHPREFKELSDGRVVRKTTREINRDRREQMLASGNWVANPQTGNLVHKGSKAGRKLVQSAFNQPKTMRITTDDGRSATLTISGTESLKDSLGDALAKKGFKQNAAGDWVDARGDVVMSAESMRQVDDRYTKAMEERAPGISQSISRRPDPPQPKPVLTPAEQLADLERNLVGGMEYNLKDVPLGNAKVKNLQVRAGETVTDALRRSLGGSPLAFDDAGNLRDSRTGKVTMTAADLENLDRDFRARALNTAFGKEAGGFADEVLYLSTNGNPAQRRRAREIIANLNGQLGTLGRIDADREAKRKEIAAVRADKTLGKSERNLRIEKLQKDFAALNGSRQRFQDDLLGGLKKINTSAKKSFDRSLSSDERKVLKLNTHILELADEHADLSARLDEDLPPDRRRALEGNRQKIQQKAFKAQRDFRKTAAKVKDPARLAGLVGDVDLGQFGFSSATVTDKREAARRAASVRFFKDEKDDKVFAVYVDKDADILRDPTGAPIRITAKQGEKFQTGVINSLSRRAQTAEGDWDRLGEIRYDIQTLRQERDKLEAAGKERKGGLKSKDRRRLRDINGKIRTAEGEAGTLESSLNDFETRKDLLDGRDLKTLAQRTVEVSEEKEASRKAYLEGARAITWVDDNGVEHRWQSQRQIEYQEERRQQLAADERRAEEDAQRLAEVRQREAQERRAGEEATVRKRRADRQQLFDTQLELEEDQLASTQAKLAEARQRYAKALADSETSGTPDRALKAAADSLLAWEGHVASQQRYTEEARAAAASNDGTFYDRLGRQKENTASARNDARSAQETLDFLADEYRKGVARGDRQEYLDRQEDWVIDARRERDAQNVRVAEEQAIYDQMIDNAKFVLVTPENNALRLAELQEKAKDAGQPPERALARISQTP